MFCAPPFTCGAFSSAAFTAAIAVNGGTMTTSTSRDSAISRRHVETNAAASPWVMFIFQFAATIFFLITPSLHYSSALELEIDEGRVVRRDKKEHDREGATLSGGENRRRWAPPPPRKNTAEIQPTNKGQRRYDPKHPHAVVL